MLVIKFQNIKRKYELVKKLDPSEIGNLFLEGIITIMAMGLIYFGFLFIFSKILYSDNTTGLNYVWRLAGITDSFVALVRDIFTLVMIAITIWLTYWRLSRRYRQIELRHVLSELEYIASGHYEHRISEDLAGRMGSVVSSINKLVDSTVEAMAEERMVEQAKNELITNVSHDIRTPLTSVIGYLGLIEENQYDSIDELKEYTHIAYTKANQMKKLADDLFEYTKMTSREISLTLQRIELSRFLIQIAVEYEPVIQQSGMNLVVENNDTVYANIDAQSIARVFDNIIHNAIKYSHGTTITLSNTTDHNFVYLHIANDGNPIDDQEMNQLFDRFYRADTSRNSQVEGSGLGLAIAQSIVNLHNGQLTVVSNEEKTIFTIRLEKLND